jgi:ADP-heptose:LPS heptosyltransferase
MARAIRKRHPNAFIAMLIRRYTRELVEGVPEIDEVLFYDDEGGILPFFKLVANIRAKHFDVICHTYPRFRLALISWVTRIPVRLGTGYRWYSFLFNKKVFEHRKDARFHELEYNLRLLHAIGIEAELRDYLPSISPLPPEKDHIQRVLVENGISADRKFVILHPGSGGSARDWSAERFKEVVRLLGAHDEVRIVVTGGRGEQKLVESIVAAAPERAVGLVERFSLMEFAALASLSKAFVANSTGPLHIAAAVGTPVIGLYPQVTALSAQRWGPLSDRRTVFSPKNKPADCTMCVGSPEGVCACMDTISADEVYKALLTYL